MVINYKINILVVLIVISVVCQSCSSKKTDKASNCIEKNEISKEEQEKIFKEIKGELKRKKIDSIYSKLAKYQQFNGAVLVSQKGVVIYENYFGVNDFKTKKEITQKSGFQLASISKTFTAVAVLQLVQNEKLSLEDTLQKFFPEFPYKDIKVIDLLCHRSGLPNYTHIFDYKRKQKCIMPNNDTILEWFQQKDTSYTMSYRPNTRFNYNNSNFAILASIIEKVSGKSYSDYMNEYIFRPLKMYDTYVDTLCCDSVFACKTKGYEGSRLRERDYFDGVYGDKGIFSTVNDMHIWYKALKYNCLINDSLTKFAFTPRSFESPSYHNYGLGFRIISNRNNMTAVNYIYHGGWWAGYTNMFWMDKNLDFCIIVLSNKKNKNLFNVKPVIQILEGKSEFSYDGSIENE